MMGKLNHNNQNSDPESFWSHHMKYGCSFWSLLNLCRFSRSPSRDVSGSGSLLEKNGLSNNSKATSKSSLLIDEKNGKLDEKTESLLKHTIDPNVKRDCNGENITSTTQNHKVVERQPLATCVVIRDGSLSVTSADCSSAKNEELESYLISFNEVPHSDIIDIKHAERNNAKISSEISTLTTTKIKCDTNILNNNGSYFLAIIEAEQVNLQSMCEAKETFLTGPYHDQEQEEVEGLIRSAVGKANLLMNKKFQQFRELCAENMKRNISGDNSLNKLNQMTVTNDDLVGYWDMILIQIQDIKNMFSEIDRIKHKNDKKTSEKCEDQNSDGSKSLNPRNKTFKNPTKTLSNRTIKNTSSNSKKNCSKLREEARQRLTAAKMVAKQKQEIKEPEVEIFVATKGHD